MLFYYPFTTWHDIHKMSQAAISYALLLGCVFGICSDTITALSFVGIHNYFAYALFSLVLFGWLILYSSGSKPPRKIETERSYYLSKVYSIVDENSLQGSDKAVVEYAVSAWVLLNNYRVKMHENSSGTTDNDRLSKSIIEYILDRPNIEFRDGSDNSIREILSKFENEYKNKKIVVNEGFLKDFLGLDHYPVDKKNEVFSALASAFNSREDYLISSNFVLRFFISLSTVNLIINGLTMYGNATGVINIWGYLFGFMVSGSYLELIRIYLLFAGFFASYCLTAPLIQSFGRDVELLIQDFSYCSSKFGSKHALAILLALCSSAASALFAVYSSPVVKLLPAAGITARIILACLTAIIAFTSSFSLYYNSIIAKLTDFESKGSLSFDVYYSAFFLIGLIAVCFFDFIFFPPKMIGLLTMLYCCLSAQLAYGDHGLMFAMAIFASFAFCLTSYHQFNVLFALDITSKYLVSIICFFQFFTFCATFYYGLAKSYLLLQDDSNAGLEASLQNPGLSSPLKGDRDFTSEINLKQSNEEFKRHSSVPTFFRVSTPTSSNPKSAMF
jgi:hypothetical protein